MNVEELERRVRRIETVLEERGRNTLRHKRWEQGIPRILVSAVFVYIVVVIFLSLIQTPESWLRALTPVIVIVLFMVVNRVARNLWFKKHQGDDPRGATDDEDMILKV